MSSTLLFRRSHLKPLLRPLAMAAAGFVLLLCWAERGRSESTGKLDLFAGLQSRLVRDGFDSSVVRTIYSRPEVNFDQRGLAAYFSHREATLNYDQFLSRTCIRRAIGYVDKHRMALHQAQKLYGVEAEIITAIMLV
ncbi:MAG: lytic murein transglycosylase, partial [Desulfobacterales bacterium]|nr:lytic murein transglycosylase [Desulfobacterales bacterium]